MSQSYKPRRPSRGPCTAPGCNRGGIITSDLGICCNKHYQRVRNYGAFDPPQRTRSRDVQCSKCGTQFDLGYAIGARRAATPQYCSTECRSSAAAQRAADTMPTRFWGWVKRGREENCWEWTGSLNPNGYGQFTWRTGNKRSHLASRVSYTLTHGEIPPGLFVCHKCDNPKCCNPHHLFLGTAKDNMQDCARKGRMNTAGLKGEKHGSAKITEKDVRDIRASRKRNCDLAPQYGLTPEAISSIRRRVTWRHV